MKAVVLKSFIISNRDFEKGEVLEIPIEALNELRSRGLVEPLSNVSEGDDLYFKPLQTKLKRI